MSLACSLATNFPSLSPSLPPSLSLSWWSSFRSATIRGALLSIGVGFMLSAMLGIPPLRLLVTSRSSDLSAEDTLRNQDVRYVASLSLSTVENVSELVSFFAKMLSANDGDVVLCQNWPPRFLWISRAALQ